MLFFWKRTNVSGFNSEWIKSTNPRRRIQSYVHLLWGTSAEFSCTGCSPGCSDEIRILLSVIKNIINYICESPKLLAFFINNTLMRELAQEEPENFRTRMSEQQFNKLLDCVGPIIQRNDTIMREALPVRLNLK